MTTPARAVLSSTQLETLAPIGGGGTGAGGDRVFGIGDATYPFIAIREGEAAVLDAAGNEIVRHGESGFLGEINLLSGQSVFLTAIVTEPMRYIAVTREALRPLLFDDAPLADLLLSAFTARREALQTLDGIGPEIIGPRSSAATRALLEFARLNRVPYTWRDTDEVENDPSAETAGGITTADLPLVRLPGGRVLRSPSPGEVSRAL